MKKILSILAALTLAALTAVPALADETGAVLPGTGGIGTTIFYVVGGVLIVGAIVVLITRSRVNRQEAADDEIDEDDED